MVSLNLVSLCLKVAVHLLLPPTVSVPRSLALTSVETLLDTAAGSPPPGTIHVPGSGIFHLVLQNTSLLREATVSAAVTHRPAEGGPSAEEEEEEKRAEAVERAAELAVLRQQDEALAASEKELSQRLWEVQETRRRQAAMMELVQRDLATLQGRVEGEAAMGPLRTANAP